MAEARAALAVLHTRTHRYQGEDPATPLFFMFHTYLDALFEKWMRQHGASAACDAALRSHTDDLWRSGQPRDAHPASCVAQSALYAGAISLSQTCVPSDPAWGYRYDETLPSDGDGDGASSESSAWAQTTTWSYVRASFAWKEFVLGFLVSGTAAVLGLRYWMHRRRQLLEAGVLELREMRLAGAIAKGVQYPAYP